VQTGDTPVVFTNAASGVTPNADAKLGAIPSGDASGVPTPNGYARRTTAEGDADGARPAQYCRPA
jgi:hypothetical protein